MTCTHAGIFSPTHHFPEVKFLCLCGGGGGYCPFIPIFLKRSSYVSGGGGGGCTFMIRNGGGGGTMLSPMLNVFRGSIFSHFPLVH